MTSQIWSFEWSSVLPCSYFGAAEGTYALSICTWFLKNQVWKIKLDELDFYCLFSLRRTWFFKLDFSKIKYRWIGRKAAGDNNLCIFSWIWIDFPTKFGKGIVYCTTLDSTGNRKTPLHFAPTMSFISSPLIYQTQCTISLPYYRYSKFMLPCNKSRQWIMYTVQTLISFEPKGKFVLKMET